MSKKLRNLALLGGLGAAAAMAMRGKGKEEESKDTTGDASAGMAKDRLSDFRGKSGDANKDIGAAVKRATTPAAEPAVTAPARRTTSVQDADAKKAAKYADQYNRDRAQSLYEQKMRRLEKEQALGRVAPEEYIGPGGALKMMSNVARGMAGRNNLRTITQPALTNEARKLTNEPLKLTNMKKGGMVGSASKRADGIATKGKTKGRMI
jgi:hypothetical protein